MSLPILRELVSQEALPFLHTAWTYDSQCLTTASVESMMVPSMSKRKPSKVSSCVGRVYSGCEPMMSD